MNTIKDLLSNIPPFLNSMAYVIVPVITAFLGFYLSKRREWELMISEEKRKRYETLITYMKQGFMDSDLSPEEKTKNKNEFYVQSYIVWLYASDNVIRNLNAFTKAFSKFCTQKNQETSAAVQESAKRLVHSMRKDTKGNTKLTSDDFVTTTVKSVAKQHLTSNCVANQGTP